MESTSTTSVPHGTHAGYTHHKCRCIDCKAAMAAYQKAYRAKNREKIIARDRAYYAANRDEKCAGQRGRYASDAEAQREYARKRYAQTADSRIRTAIEWARANPESRETYRSKRKALARNAGVYRFSGDDWLRLQRRFGYRCAYCGSRAKLTQDHVVPLTRGGRHAIGNILPACGSCNSSKGNRLLLEWSRRPEKGTL